MIHVRPVGEELLQDHSPWCSALAGKAGTRSGGHQTSVITEGPRGPRSKKQKALLSFSTSLAEECCQETHRVQVHKHTGIRS